MPGNALAGPPPFEVSVDAPVLEAEEREKNEGLSMPRYEFMCEKCNKPLEVIMTFTEREKGEVKCRSAKA